MFVRVKFVGCVKKPFSLWCRTASLPSRSAILWWNSILNDRIIFPGDRENFTSYSSMYIRILFSYKYANNRLDWLPELGNKPTTERADLYDWVESICRKMGARVFLVFIDQFPLMDGFFSYYSFAKWFP